MNPLISIIVPVYNVEKYLPQCLDSLKKQTYKNLEIILVDDGSMDNGGKLCDEFAENNNNVVVIHQENQGLSAARNAGVKASKGQYITFLDSDDWIVNEYVEYLYKLINKYNADISCTSYYSVWDDQIPALENKSTYHVQVFETKKALEEICYGDNFGCSAPDKMYKRELIDHNPFPVEKLYEDLGVMYKIVGEASKLVYSPRKMSFYRRRSTSIINAEYSDDDLYIIEAAEEQLKYIKKNYKDCIKAAEAKCGYVLTQIVSKVLSGSERDKEVFKIIREKAKIYWRAMVFNSRTPVKHKVRMLSILAGYSCTKGLYGINNYIKKATGKKMQS